MSTDNEVIYTQGDMDRILEKLRNEQKESEQSRQLLWAVIEAAGGEVAVPHKLFIEGPSDRELLVWDNHAEFKMHLRVRKKEE